MTAMIIFWIAMVFSIGCAIKRTSDSNHFTQENKTMAKELHDLAYWDYDSKIYRMVSTNERCIRILDFDDDYNRYYIYLREETPFNKGKSRFIAAQYDRTDCDPPVKFPRKRIDFMLREHQIYNEAELYKRWQ